MGAERVGCEQGGVAAGENQGLRREGAECVENARAIAAVENGYAAPERRESRRDQGFQAGVSSRDDRIRQRSMCARQRAAGTRRMRWASRLARACARPADPANRRPGNFSAARTRASRSDCVEAVAQKHGLASVERCGKLFRAGDESDEVPAAWRKEAGDVDQRALAGGVLNFQDTLAHRAACGGKCRGKQDGARSEGAMRGQNFSGKRAAGRGVDLLEQKCLGTGGKSCGSARLRCATLWRAGASGNPY